MSNFESKNVEIADGVNLLVSILIRHPQISTISFSPSNNCLKLKFMLSAVPLETEFTIVKQLLMSSIAAYNILEGSSLQTSEIQLDSYNSVAMLNIARDIKSITSNEIALITALLEEHLQQYLIIDPNESLLEEDLRRQEEVIDDMLENIKYHRKMHALIGIREDGRVLIFNK